MKRVHSKKFVKLMFMILPLIAVPACMAQENAWTGTWRLNHEKSRLGGPTFLLTISPQGEYEIAAGSNHFKFYCDGKYRVVVGQRTFACLKATDASMEVLEKQGGSPVLKVHRELSSNGKTLTQITTKLSGPMTGTAEERTFVRFSKSSDLAGAWMDVKALDRQPQVLVTALKGPIFHLSFPMEKQYTDARLDGSESLIHGTYSGTQATLSLKPETSQRLLTVEKLNGLVLNDGVMILSSDGQSITEETWKPEAAAVKTRLVYEKR